MNLDKIAEIANVSLNNKVSARNKNTYKELFTALLTSENISDAARALNTTTAALEHTLSRNIKPLFPDKTRGNKWNNYLYSVLGYKKCTGCSELLPINSYSKNTEAPDGYSYYCKDCRSIMRKKFASNNPEYSKQDYINNKSEYIARAIKYKTRRELATPPWADLNIIAKIYECAEDCHVDHVIPLQGELVCGLHVENNLQYLSVEENLRKSNKFVTDWD